MLQLVCSPVPQPVSLRLSKGFKQQVRAKNDTKKIVSFLRTSEELLVNPVHVSFIQRSCFQIRFSGSVELLVLEEPLLNTYVYLDFLVKSLSIWISGILE